MLKIEFKEKIDKKYNLSIVVNDIEDLESFYSKFSYRSGHFYSEEVIDMLCEYSFEDVKKHFDLISFGTYEYDWWEGGLAIDVACHKILKSPHIKITIRFPEWEHWAKLWSMTQFAESFKICLTELKQLNIEYWEPENEDDNILNGFGLIYFPNDVNQIIGIELGKTIEIVKKIVINANKNLLLSIDENSITTIFHFPQEIQSACKQYLVYFAQFLFDIGIQANTEIKDNTEYTLFRVIPNDSTEVLENIKHALSLYLEAPTNLEFPLQAEKYNDIAVKQWEANIYHLKSQLALATSIIQAKESTIEMLQLSNYQYRHILDRGTNVEKENQEEIIKGIVTVDKYEIQGITINLAELLRRLKRKFSK